MSRRSRRGLPAAYPILIGLLALGALIALSASRREAPIGEADAGADGTADRDAATFDTPLERRWRVTGVPEGLPASGPLKACLAQAGYRKAQVLSAVDARLISYPGLPAPVAIRSREGAWQIATPVESDRALALALHVLVTSCLQGPGRAVFDPQLDRPVAPTDELPWPSLTEIGGVPVHLLIRAEQIEGGWRSKGLAALALPELALIRQAPQPGDRDLVEMAAGQLVALGRPADGRLSLDGVAVALSPWAQLKGLPWWPAGWAPKGALMVMVEPGRDPPIPPLATVATADAPRDPGAGDSGAGDSGAGDSGAGDASGRDPKPRRRSARRAAWRRPARPSARPEAPLRPSPKPRPTFMPDYIE